MTNFEIYKENRDTIQQIVNEFSAEDAKEIIARIFCGESVDSAIQSVICEF